MKFLKVSAVVATLAISLGLGLTALRPNNQTVIYPNDGDFPITMCGTVFRDGPQFDSLVSLLPGLGDLHYRVTTTDSAAQKYFDQGLRLVYGFNHAEALRSFKEASRRDPSCAMAWWGQALALGPNINDDNPKKREAAALTAITRAKELSVGSSEKEKDFIRALSARYDGESHANRGSLNTAYIMAMETVSKKYSNDPEASCCTQMRS